MQAYHVQPSGAIGEPPNPNALAPEFPLPPPTPVATGTLDASGGFQLALPDANPVVIQVTRPGSSFPLEAAVPTPGSGPVVITAFTSIAEQLAMFSMRSGLDARTAITQANAAMASYLGLGDLLSTSPTTSALYASELNGLSQQAQSLSLDLQDTIGALGDDVKDGVFNGQWSGQPLQVGTTSGTRVPLPPTLLTTGVFAKAEGPRFKADGQIAPPPANYRSPYSLSFTAPGLLDDFSQFPRNEVKEQSQNPVFADWYNLSYWKDTTNPGIISERDWGPTSALYPAPRVPANLPQGMTAAEWRQQRVVATAASYLQLPYQHHHIPGWNPPRNWPYWKKVAEGHITPGLDCSNFSSWNYNYGLGLKLDGAPMSQGEQTQVDNANGTFRSRVVLEQKSQSPENNPIPYKTFKDTLQPGDLLYIKGEPWDKPGQHITHVIMWVGNLGQGSGDVPLIIDSHGPVVIDQNGVTIPNGVFLRPFYDATNKPKGTGQDWYLAAFDHAVRWTFE